MADQNYHVAYYCAWCGQSFHDVDWWGDKHSMQPCAIYVDRGGRQFDTTFCKHMYHGGSPENYVRPYGGFQYIAMNKDTWNQTINADMGGVCRYDMHIFYSTRREETPRCIKCGQKEVRYERRSKKNI